MWEIVVGRRIRQRGAPTRLLQPNFTTATSGSSPLTDVATLTCDIAVTAQTPSMISSAVLINSLD